MAKQEKEIKYEIPVNYFEGKHHETIIGLLTGLTLEEIQAVTPRREKWRTRDYLHAFYKLGFNTNVRFIAFHPETQYPCIMRCRAKPDTGYWYGYVYYDNIVYASNNFIYTLDDFINYLGDQLRVTSMLQVWI